MPAVQETSIPWCAGTGYVRTVIRTRLVLQPFAMIAESSKIETAQSLILQGHK
jgi:hypothetical protein